MTKPSLAQQWFAGLRWGRSTRQSNWREEEITDQWFASHFLYAADVVHEALSPVCNPRTSTLLDFGCYDGITGLGLCLRHGWKRVIGVDIDPGFAVLPGLARQQLQMERLPSQLTFRRIRPAESLAPIKRVDAIMSWSVFEHVSRSDLDTVVADFHSVLAPGGFCFVQIEPLYFSPQGSHLGRFATLPWAHLRMAEDDLERFVMSASPEAVPPGEITEQFRSMPFADYKRFIFRHYKELNRIKADELIELFLRNDFGLVWERRLQTSEPVPSDLLLQYDGELLQTNEIRALFRSIRE